MSQTLVMKPGWDKGSGNPFHRTAAGRLIEFPPGVPVVVSDDEYAAMTADIGKSLVLYSSVTTVQVPKLTLG